MTQVELGVEDMSSMNYQELYKGYWDRPDRWGSHSFVGAERFADQILSVCGGGRLLDVGCGMGGLVQALLRKGMDAHGMDVAERPVRHLNTIMPGRFHLGSILGLPFADESFDTVVCTDVLEHLAEQDVAQALRELHRVARSRVFLAIATAPDRDNRWHLTVHGRDWWENRLFAVGFRKHPRGQHTFPYESLEHEGTPINVVLEKMPGEALARYPLEALAAERDLHMDMLRETGRRSDAHIARYQLASLFVRPGDVVLDAACGLGYGSAVLAASSPAARVLGIDASQFAAEYAQANYAGPGIEFMRHDVADLPFLPDNSVDYVVSMETLEHLPDPEKFLAEIRRVLRPSGRIMASVPNEWVDEHGRDPNPTHLHVYTWPKLSEQLGRHFIVERLYAQIAGGSMKLGDRPRSLREVSLEAHAGVDAEWWLALSMKNPVGAGKTGYTETSFPDHGDRPDYHLTTFGRDYDNPWLVKAMVMISMRSANARVLEQMAEGVLQSARPGSADAGAAICILAYRLLERADFDAVGADAVLDRIAAYHAAADGSPHAWRWRISNQYAAGLLLMATGRLAEARRAFLECAGLDCLKFAPILATKTVGALFQAGLIAADGGNLEQAAANWQAGLREARRVLSGDWINVWGSPDRPADFGLSEAAQVLDAASRCACGLTGLSYWTSRPGYAWTQTFRDLGSQMKGLRDAKFWLERQCANWQAAIEDSEKISQERHAWIGELEKAKVYLLQDRDRWQALAEKSQEGGNLQQRQIEDLRAQLADLGQEKERLAAWIARMEQTLWWRLGKNIAGLELPPKI